MEEEPEYTILHQRHQMRPQQDMVTSQPMVVIMVHRDQVPEVAMVEMPIMEA
jgi:hypothetical protein